jgi:hypothetical protein
MEVAKWVSSSSKAVMVKALVFWIARDFDPVFSLQYLRSVSTSQE